MCFQDRSEQFTSLYFSNASDPTENIKEKEWVRARQRVKLHWTEMNHEENSRMVSTKTGTTEVGSRVLPDEKKR